MKASEAIVILEALDPSTEVTLVISRAVKAKPVEPFPGREYVEGRGEWLKRTHPIDTRQVFPASDFQWPHYPQYTITNSNVH
jgi:hypothetical protein